MQCSCTAGMPQGNGVPWNNQSYGFYKANGGIILTYIFQAGGLTQEKKENMEANLPSASLACGQGRTKDILT